MTPNTLGGGLPAPRRFAAIVVDGATRGLIRLHLTRRAGLGREHSGNAHDPVRDFEKSFPDEQSQGIADAVKFAFVRPKCTSQALDPPLGADHLPVLLGEAVQQIANAARHRRPGQVLQRFAYIMPAALVSPRLAPKRHHAHETRGARQMVSVQSATSVL